MRKDEGEERGRERGGSERDGLGFRGKDARNIQKAGDLGNFCQQQLLLW